MTLSSGLDDIAAVKRAIHLIDWAGFKNDWDSRD
jgi:hypothetical protein